VTEANSDGGPRKRRGGGGAATAADAKKREVVVLGFEKKGLKRRAAEELERGIFQLCCPAGEALDEGGERFKAYKIQYKRFCTHLRRNSAIADRLAHGKVSGGALAAMDDEALMADAQRHEREQFRQEALREALGASAEDSAHWTPSDQFVCPRCESTRCVYIEMFTGSTGYDDNNREPTITIRCAVCKHLWKEDEVDGGRLAAGLVDGAAPPGGSETGGAAVPTGVAAAVAGARETAPAAAKQKLGPPPAPAIWGEGEGRKAPTWELPL